MYFGDRKDDDEFFAKVDFTEQVTGKNVVCIRVPQAAEIKAPATAIMPAGRLAAADLWAAYGVSKADTFIIADRYGNPSFTGTEPVLNEKIGEVASNFRKQRKELRKKNDAAQKAADAGDTKAALAELKEGFKLGLTGYDEAETAAKLYGKLLESGRASLKAAAKDVKALEALATTYEGTDLAGEIDAALKAARKGSN